MPLGRRADLGDAKYAGVEVPFAHDMDEAMQPYLNCGFDFVVAPLVRPPPPTSNSTGASPSPPPATSVPLPLARPHGPSAGALPASPRDGLMLTPASAGGQIVGAVSAWIDPDADDPREAARACEVMAQELAWAAFLGLQAVVVPPPPRAAPRGRGGGGGDGRLSNYAQVISQALSGLTHMAVWVRLPLTDPGLCDGPVQAAKWRSPGPPPEADDEEEEDGGGGGGRAARDARLSEYERQVDEDNLAHSLSRGCTDEEEEDEADADRGGDAVGMAGVVKEEGGGKGAVAAKQQRARRRADRRVAATGADSWAAWNQVCTMCERSPLLGVMLDLSSWGRDRAAAAGEQQQQLDADAAAARRAAERWLGEPLRAVAVSSAADFAPNRRGFPVMRRELQPLVELAFQHNVQLVLTGGGGGGEGQQQQKQQQQAAPTGADPTPAEAAAALQQQQQQHEQHPLRPYWDFCSYLFRRASNGETVLTGDTTTNGGGCGGADGANPPDHNSAAAAELIAYRDYLQAPLQPLQDNLESQTYETFERDSIKYERYRAAVEAALVDLVPIGGGRGARRRQRQGAAGGNDGGGAASSEQPPAAPPPPPPRWSAADDPGDSAPDEGGMPTTVLMVVGAGRGPLVRASIEAAEAVGRPLRVYALEKNPAALVHVQALVARTPGWSRVVTIVGADMREWDPPEPADVLVSELLGSFGDNELSPECLDGAQRRLLRPGGVSIPASYTSYLAPVAACKLWEAARAYKDLEHLETPYVVRPHRHALLSPPQRVFRFAHPNPSAGFYGGGGGGGGRGQQLGGQQQQQLSSSSSSVGGRVDNTRRAALAFPRRRAQGPAVCHGFIGYFSCVLYKNVTLSTHPDDHTPNMASWFPIFFPLRDPLPLAAGERLDAAVWRCSGAGRGRVWYEWAATAPRATAIHNPGGRSYWVGL